MTHENFIRLKKKAPKTLTIFNFTTKPSLMNLRIRGAGRQHGLGLAQRK